MRKLGSIQKNVLCHMAEYMPAWGKTRTWEAGCGWVWTNPSDTTKILESLVKRGLMAAENRPKGGPLFTITEEGLKVAEEINNEKKLSWYCQPCNQEVYSLRCKYCGKSEEEEL